MSTSDHKLSYENIGRVLACIQFVRGDDWEFCVSEYEPIHAALYPEDEARLATEKGHSLHDTVGGRIYDYWKHQNGKYGPSIERLSGAPDPRYRIRSCR
jgi:hypothetical protein